jgi:sterol desaturase/sphingolipid hydroxylase (fatty acid hydroxylase superfamily)
MEWLSVPLGFFQYILIGLIMYGCFMLVERIRPAEAHQPFRHILFNLKWYCVYSVISLSLSAIGLGLMVGALQQWFGAPYIKLPVPHSALGIILATLLYFLITDFFYYWFHRTQHTVSFFWEQHKFHHSEVSLNVTSSRRVHWLEDPLILLFIGIPMNLVVQIPGLEIGILAFIEVLWLQFIHMNLRLGLGRFTSIVVFPQYHRLHHSFAPEHLNKNYAAFFPIWDIVFGTYYQPKKGEFPATGLTTGETYNNLWIALILPFREWLGAQYFRAWVKGK